MTIFQFMAESPFLTFCMCYMLTVTLLRMWKAVVRHLNIRKAGWPPPHLDADGYFKDDSEPEDESPENAGAVATGSAAPRSASPDEIAG
jgi:hypothetical protein